MHGAERLTVTLPTEVAEHARQAVAEGRADSVSAYVREAVVDRAGRARSDHAWAEHFAENGAPRREHYVYALRQVLDQEPPAELVEEMIRRDAELMARHRPLDR